MSAPGRADMAASHLVVLFCATAGQNGENLGSDEEQIVLFVYLLYDVANNKVSSRDKESVGVKMWVFHAQVHFGAV